MRFKTTVYETPKKEEEKFTGICIGFDKNMAYVVKHDSKDIQKIPIVNINYDEKV